METVSLDGVDYVKASVAAKQFRYTSDYIGQLCRSKKIDARLVGRTWFVNSDSLIEHRKKKHERRKAQKEASLTAKMTNEIKPSRKIVMPVVQGKVNRVIKDAEIDKNLSRKLRVYYDRDEESLIPKLKRKKTRPPKTVRIEQVNAKKVRIVANNQNKVSFLAEKLPDVALSGELAVKTYSSPKPKKKEENEANVKPQVKSELKEEKTKQKNTVLEAPKKISVISATKKKPQNEKKPQKKPQQVLEVTTKDTLARVAVDKTAVNKTFLDKSAKKPIPKDNKPKSELEPTVSPLQFTPALVQSQPNTKVPTAVLISPLLATLGAVVCVALIMSASSSIEVFDSAYESQIILQVANLLDIFRG